MKKLRYFLLISILWIPGILCAKELDPILAKGFEIQKTLERKNLNSFTWDEHGSLWILRAEGNRLFIEDTADSTRTHSFKRHGTHSSSLLVNGDKVFVSDASAIRVFQISRNRLLEIAPLVPPRDFFPATTRISTLRWSPLGHIHFACHTEPGIGRFDPYKNQWDILSKGIEGGNFSFDPEGLMIASDSLSGHLFRVAYGLDYARGLENYSKADVALHLDKAGLKPGALAVYSGSQWPRENNSTWIVYDRQSSSLRQFSEEVSHLKYLRNLADWKGPVSLSQFQIGPDGALWFIANDSILRLEASQGKRSEAPSDLSKQTTTEVAAFLNSDNSWHRDTALRILESRKDLRAIRALHPSTVLHKMWSEKTNAPLTRVHALWALHRVNLLDEGALEDGSDDPSPLLRAWSARLFGERNYPTGPAFKQLEKLAHDTNMVVRIAVEVAARQFVSGSFLRDTPPVIPIREVFTGGILSTLWFSTEKGSTPEFDLLYWNAVKPITAVDAGHPLGFFNGDREQAMSLAYWLITRITRQVAQISDPTELETALRVLSELKPGYHRMLSCALDGIKSGSASRRVVPTEASRDMVTQFAKSQHTEVATRANEILVEWGKAPPKKF